MAYKTPKEIKTELAERFGLDFSVVHRILLFTFGRPYCRNNLSQKDRVIKIPGLGVICDDNRVRRHIDKRKLQLKAVEKNSEKSKKCLDF